MSLISKELKGKGQKYRGIANPPTLLGMLT